MGEEGTDTPRKKNSERKDGKDHLRQRLIHYASLHMSLLFVFKDIAGVVHNRV